MSRFLVALLIPFALGACEQLGIPDPQKQAAAAEAEGRAIGGACRHAGRALEDCYTLNPAAGKAAVFEGWRTMNDYMTENKIEVVPPSLPAAGMLMPRARNVDDEAHETPAEADSAKAGAKPDAKPERPVRSSTLRSQQER